MKLKSTDIKFLQLKLIELRIKILEIIFSAKKGHIGGCYSCLEIIFLIYYYKLVSPKKKYDISKDNIFFLSKAHASLTLYVVLNYFGIIKNDTLLSFNKNSNIGEHYDHKINGCLSLGGSLGNSLGIACGISLSRKNNSKIIILLGDGEMSEGSVWESLLMIQKKNIRNIFIFIDANSLLTLEKTQGFLDKKSLKKKFKSFDLDVFECDGHDVSNIFDLYSKLAKRTKSCVVIFDTIKGKGINFMENNSIWHHKVPNIKEYDKGIYALRNSLNY